MSLGGGSSRFLSLGPSPSPSPSPNRSPNAVREYENHLAGVAVSHVTSAPIPSGQSVLGAWCHVLPLPHGQLAESNISRQRRLPVPQLAPGLQYLAEMENQAQGMPEPEVSQRQYNARRFRTVDVQDLFEDSRRLPVPQLAPGLSVYRRPRMDEEGVPENAEVV